MMKKVFALVLCAGMVLAALAGCGSAPQSSAPSDSATTSASAAPQGQKLKIGVIQMMDHPSLNEIYQSFKAELAAQGYDDSKVEIDYQCGQGDFANLNTISQKFVGQKVDMIVAIATPAAQAAAAATSDIPVIFSAITDPVAAGLVTSLEKPDRNITGTSDAIPVDAIFKLADQLTPGIKTYGFIYNSSEVNSISVITAAKAYCDANGLKYVESTVTNTGEVHQAALQLISKADALFAPIDNTVASVMPNLSQLCIDNKKPIYVAADSMVNDGGLASVGVNYTNLGKETAKMAVEVLGGKAISEVPVRTLSEFAQVINPDTKAALGIQ